MSQSHYVRRKIQAARDRGKRMANRRWQLDRERRDKLAALTAEQLPAKIVRRVIVIDNETTVREAVIWSFDYWKDQQRKIRAVLA